MPGGVGTLLTTKCPAPGTHRATNARGLPGGGGCSRLELTRTLRLVGSISGIIFEFPVKRNFKRLLSRVCSPVTHASVWKLLAPESSTLTFKFIKTSRARFENNPPRLKQQLSMWTLLIDRRFDNNDVFVQCMWWGQGGEKIKREMPKNINSQPFLLAIFEVYSIILRL